jgi:pyruvate dehydrogenase E1 component alpha subunit
MSSKMSKNDANHIYKTMLTIRKFEEKCGQAYGMGLIAGFCHLYIGQEAVVTGIKENLEDGDSIITSYRDHAHNLVVGTDPKYIMAELMGKKDGVSQGKGGSMHLFDTEKGFFGGHGIVGAQVPIGTGLAFANKYKENGKICVTFFGDGAANQGQVYEAFNMAKIMSLPVLYVVENNKYAMGTSTSRHSASKYFHTRGDAYEIENKLINGMDVVSVIEETKSCIDYVRSGKGPMLIEIETYRYRGHSMSDPAKYRTKDELEEYKCNDPISLFEEYAKKNKLLSQDDFDKMESEIKKEVQDAYDFAMNSPEPDASELMTDIYKD